MFATVDRQRLYLTTWCCNALRVFGILADIVEKSGGRVKPAHTAVITDRVLENDIFNCRKRLDELTAFAQAHGPNTARDAAIADYRKRLDRLSSIDNSEREVYGQSWITFVLNGKKYYVSVDDNPLFGFMYIKTPVSPDGTYSADASADTLDGSWAEDCLLDYDCTDAQRRKAARMLFDTLRAADDTPIIRDKKRIRVQNRYDWGCHYETIYDKPRISRIDF